MKKYGFWIRVGLFILFGLLLPVSFIIWRYDLFTEVSTTTFGIWGLMALGIILAFGGVCYKYIKRAFTYSYGIQVVGGFVKVIVPCLFIWVCAYKLQDSIELFVQVMGVITICEIVAILVNPLPKWVQEHKTERATDFFNVMFDKWEEGKK